MCEAGKTTYDRLIATAVAEQILSQALVHVSYATLKNEARKTKSSEVYRWLKKAIEGDGFVQCKWYGRDKRTFRIYPKRGELPFTNVSNPAILQSLTSRYEDGRIVCIDYSNHEYRILRSMFGMNDLPKDLHTYVSNLLNIERDEAKLLNNIMLYGKDDDVLRAARELAKNHNPTSQYIKTYFNLIMEIRVRIREYLTNIEPTYNRYGFVVNPYGRKVYPKNKSTIFNNVIQSVGSELLIDSLLELNKAQHGRRWNIIFQRFDSIYFDFDQEALRTNLRSVVETMESINEDIDLSVNVSVGNSVGGLKEINR